MRLKHLRFCLLKSGGGAINGSSCIIFFCRNKIYLMEKLRFVFLSYKVQEKKILKTCEN